MLQQEPYQLRGYYVKPRKITDIRVAAEKTLEVLKLNGSSPDLCQFLESLSAYGITIDIVDDDEDEFLLAGVEAVCVPDTATIYLTNSTYEKACLNDPRTRFTIFHELGHFILRHTKLLHRANLNQTPKRWIDSEWQADQFAAEMTMPIAIIKSKKLYLPMLIQAEFGVSSQAASRRFNQLTKQGDLQ